MKLISVLLTVLIAGCRDVPPPVDPIVLRAWPKDECEHKYVYVYAAKTRILAEIYSDFEMTTPLPNPFLTNCNGSYKFWSKPNIEVDVK